MTITLTKKTTPQFNAIYAVTAAAGKKSDRKWLQTILAEEHSLVCTDGRRIHILTIHSQSILPPGVWHITQRKKTAITVEESETLYQDYTKVLPAENEQSVAPVTIFEDRDVSIQDRLYRQVYRHILVKHQYIDDVLLYNASSYTVTIFEQSRIPKIAVQAGNLYAVIAALKETDE